MKKIFIRTLGCQMNVRDSEVIAGLLMTNNYQLTTNPDDADIFIFNTCSVRQHAEDKVWSEIGRIAKTFAGAKKKIIGLVGCMAQNYKEQAFQRAPAVDFVVGPADIGKIPGIMDKLLRTEGDSPLLQRRIWETDGENRPEEIYHSGFYQDKEHAFVVISEGCSNFCSYCVVPYVRGKLRHRQAKDILREVQQAVDKGITKITLLGQNVNALPDFIGLLQAIDELKGLKELSFITSHPKDTSAGLFQAMADLKTLKKALHLPVQSGSDRVLKLMNRGYIRDYYLHLVEDYRKIVKSASITTDIIVGFPSETKEDFQDTFDLVNKVEFNAAYIFKYSVRPHTDAARLADDVAKEEKERRHALILQLQKKISLSKNAKL